MYLPASFEEKDLQTLQEFIKQNNFGVLVNNRENRLEATHLPLLLDESRGTLGTLVGHMARANKQWQAFKDGEEALVIFHGAHAYVSPSWYETHPSVPTWNYVAVHAYGRPRLLKNFEELHDMLKGLVDYHESGFEKPWPMELPQDYMERMMKAIAGFEIEITRLEGKYKLSQNRDEIDRHNVVIALEQSHNPVENEVSRLMKERAQQ
jgi:transcriptional regulator